MNPSHELLTKAVIRADHAMPGNQLYYFEIEVMEGAEDKSVARIMFSFVSL